MTGGGKAHYESRIVRRLIAARQLMAYPYKGFWAGMDTFKDKQRLDDLHAKGDAPWEIRVRKELEEKVPA